MEEERRIDIATENMPARVTVAGHPLHAMLTDLPIGCFVLAVLWNIIAVVANRQPWYAMTFWALLTGLILVIPTALIGLLDYTKVLERRHAGRATATLHLVANVSATLFFLLSLIFRGGPGVLGTPAKVATLLLALAGIAILGVGGYLGGRLVYDYGVGVNSRRQ